MGWLVGYDGHFHFENISDPYVENNVPYVAFRALPAILGTLTVPVVFLTMWESGYSLPASILAAALIIFDNAHIGQTRLILLDATLVFAMACSVLCYVRFYKLRHDAFGRKWWKWLILTGVSLSCVISTKYVGAFTFFSIGCAVVIDLWDLLDIHRRQGALSIQTFGKHFGARLVGLIIVPFMFYLFWFQVHFAILTRSGPGDDFMTPEFQATLSDNLMTAAATPIEYYDVITLRHKETKVYLHSHNENYPLRYDDGRISSQGQQVTGYPFEDLNNQWQILPPVAFPEHERTGHRVKTGDIIKLRHTVTDSMLLSHDVASPSHPTNQEFTTTPADEADGPRHNDTLWELRVDGARGKQDFQTMASHFKLIHYPTRVAMWTHTTPLPEWAFKQAEINGNKNVQQSSNVWFAEAIPSLPTDSPRLQKESRQVKQMPFLKKYLELQRAMFYHNNALTSSHPYASHPIQWPFLLRGVSFWTQADTRRQIYFLGNPIGWWLTSSLLAVFAGIIGADQLSLRRGIDVLEPRKSSIPSPREILLTRAGVRRHLYNSTGFFFLMWAAHYLPFYLMGRQLFLHHYLPSHLASCLVTGGLYEFVFAGEAMESAEKLKNEAKGDSKTKRSTARDRWIGQNLWTLWIAVIVTLALVIFGWAFFLPLTYGMPGLSVEQVKARKWLGYDLHFAK
jgi:dolichyl-phosphate-mannose-protein mannosyltransferase